ncbi:hypothetical protein BC831DRAFT_76993 [Entophlyctis helioformis]|nr:hypothetical protein BC831DRAFT_76993 [Entophlyctis helioformis]
MAKPQHDMDTINAWVVTVMQLMIHRAWTRGMVQASADKMYADKNGAQQADTIQTDMQEDVTYQAALPYRLDNTLCGSATSDIFNNLAREVCTILARHYIGSQFDLAVGAAIKLAPGMSREQAKELVQSLFKEADAAKAAAAKDTAPRPSAAKRGRQTSAASSTEDAASSPTKPKRARRKSAAPNPSSADLDTTLPAPSNKRGQSGSSSATDKSGAKKARGKKPAAKDAAGKKSAVVTPPALHKLVAIIRNMSLSTVGRFKQLRDLAGRESIKLCPQAASRDPFVLITETVLFWAVMGLKRDRTSKSQDPVLRALRLELLAAIKPGWLLKELNWKDSELALRNKAIDKAFSSSDELRRT